MSNFLLILEPQLKAVKTRLECRSGRWLEVKVGGDPTVATVHGSEVGTRDVKGTGFCERDGTGTQIEKINGTGHLPSLLHPWLELEMKLSSFLFRSDSALLRFNT